MPTSDTSSPPQPVGDLLEEARAMMARATATAARRVQPGQHSVRAHERSEPGPSSSVPRSPLQSTSRRRSASPLAPAVKRISRESPPTSSSLEIAQANGDVDARSSASDPWAFGTALVDRFPALGQRSFFCIQWHQATALHYDLRLQCAFASDAGLSGIVGALDGPTNAGTLSFAIPLGAWDTRPGEMRLAVETNIHSIAYTTFEGPQAEPGRPSRTVGAMPRATLLWEIGSYTIVGPSAPEPEGRHDSSGGEEDEDDDNGGDDSAHSSVDAYAQERLLLDGVRKGKFTVTLHGHCKLYSLTLRFRRTAIRFDGRGRPKVEWSVLRASGEHLVTGAEDGGWHRSILTGRTLREVGEGASAAVGDGR